MNTRGTASRRENQIHASTRPPDSKNPAISRSSGNLHLHGIDVNGVAVQLSRDSNLMTIMRLNGVRVVDLVYIVADHENRGRALIINTRRCALRVRRRPGLMLR